MKRKLPLFVTAILLLAFAPFARADLRADVDKAIRDKSLRRAKVGVEIIQLGEAPDAVRAAYRHKADEPLIPASNLKLVTTAAALEVLGRDFRFRTVLVARGQDVALIGDGDPALGDAEMLRKVGWDVDTVFKSWAAALKKRNITSVRNVYVDDSIFDEIFVHPNWPPEQQHKRYVAQVGGVNLNANCVDFFLTYTSPGDYVTYATDPATSYVDVGNICTSGDRNAVWLARQLGGNSIVLRGETNASNREPISVTVHDPALYAATVLAETLRAEGIDVQGEVLRDRTIREDILHGSPAADGAEPWKAIAIHETPIAPVLARSNKDSMNLYAEALCKRIGQAASGTSGSWANGTAAVGSFLQGLGINGDEFVIDDGCGLSKQNAVSANAIARVLAHAFHSDNRQAFVESLSIAGADGTLEKRFRGSDLQGRVFAKSGYVSGVSSLSGYVKAKDESWYAFSILMNGVTDIATAKAVQEKVVEAIDRDAR